MREWVTRVMAELPGTGGAEKAMHGGGGDRVHCIGHIVTQTRDAHIGAHRLGHTVGRLPGRRGQCNFECLPAGRGQPMGRREEERDRPGLSGARAAGDDGESAGQGPHDGFALEVGRRGVVVVEEVADDGLELG
jgi:hypothetical protein